MQNTHGGNVYRASREYAISRDELLDYSANVNPLGVPRSLKRIITSSIDGLADYPDPECSDLKAEISAYLNIPEDMIVIGNGASEVIFLLFDVLRPKKVIIPAPAFSEYASAAQNYGTEVEYFELREDELYRLDTSSLISKMEPGVDAVFLCNPNNPTSTLADRGDLMDLIGYACERDIFVMIDETFIELTSGGNGNSMADVLCRYKNLFIIRAFTKLFAIPGLRLGYGLGDREIVRAMWEKKLPWSVNSLACQMGKVLSEDGDYLERTRRWLEEEKQWFYAELCSIPGLKVFEPQTNFVLMKILDRTLNAALLRDRMAAEGILIRDAGNFVFLNDKFFRAAIKDRVSNIRFLKGLRDAMK